MWLSRLYPNDEPHMWYGLTHEGTLKPSWFGTIDMFVVAADGLVYPVRDNALEAVRNRFCRPDKIEQGIFAVPIYSLVFGYDLVMTEHNLSYPAEDPELQKAEGKNEMASMVMGIPVYGDVLFLQAKARAISGSRWNYIRDGVDLALRKAIKYTVKMPEETYRLKVMRITKEKDTMCERRCLLHVDLVIQPK
jgi:hypothetical protein